jgi:hypothetical protein
VTLPELKRKRNLRIKRRIGFGKRRNSEFSGEFPEGFLEQFEWLVDVIGRIDKSKYHSDADRADLFPRKNLLWLSIVLYATGTIYCLARVGIIALAFSSLRSMADSVYETTWTTAIPNVQ